MTDAEKKTSTLVEVANILEKNGFRVLKAEEVLDDPHAYRETINLQIVSKKLINAN